MKLVVAGNYSEFLFYCRENRVSPTSREVIYVDRSDKMRGHREYELIYYGTYRDRGARDLDEIAAIHRANGMR